MSGGGDKGSYQASVFIEFTNLLPPEEVSYDVVTGASAGSLNGVGLSLFAPGEEADAAIFIYGLWNSITASDIFENWRFGIIEGLFFRSGIFNYQPLIDFLHSQVGPRTLRKKFTATLSNTDSGHAEFFNFEPSDTLPDKVIPAVVGSSAIPFAFPSMSIDGKTYIDGGCIWNLDVAGAINRCKEIVDDDADIIVDIILCSSIQLGSPGDLKKYKALDHYMRAKEIYEWQDYMQDIERNLEMFKNVEFRYVLAPSETLSVSPIPLDFSKKHLDY